MSDDRMRLDVWLWRARFFKTRTGASDAIVEAGARIERDGQVRRVDRPATPVAVGDLLNFTAPGGARTVRIVAFPDRRGPPAEAQACYERLDRRSPPPGASGAPDAGEGA